MPSPRGSNASEVAELIVVGAAGFVASLIVDRAWTTWHAKRLIEDTTGIPVHSQRLFEGDVELEQRAALGRVRVVHLVRRPEVQAVWLKAVEESWCALRLAPLDIRRDREVLLVAVAHNGHALQYASVEVRVRLHLASGVSLLIPGFFWEWKTWTSEHD